MITPGPVTVHSLEGSCRFCGELREGDLLMAALKGELEEGLRSLGLVRISDVDRAQQNVVGLIRKMEEDGEIVVARQDELFPG
ncbi:MAG: hypothetical protein JXA95_12845 [Spirochaetales bacterium]|nr:hypothetical protein [Spirochaetales bacterium]